MCDEENCKGNDCTGHGEREELGLQPNRFVVTGYVCDECDSDFGVNEFGMKTKDGVHAVRCPVCGCNRLMVYHLIAHSKHPFPAPTLCKEVLDAIRKEQDKINSDSLDYRIPNDGHHGLDDSLIQWDGEDIREDTPQRDYYTIPKNFDTTSSSVGMSSSCINYGVNADTVSQVREKVRRVVKARVAKVSEGKCSCKSHQMEY